MGRIFESGDLFVSRKNNFSDSLENIDGNVTKISRRGFNPPLTILSVGISTLIVGIIAWGQDPL
jgi:hypothetical protein